MSDREKVVVPGDKVVVGDIVKLGPGGSRMLVTRVGKRGPDEETVPVAGTDCAAVPFPSRRARTTSSSE